MQRCMLGGINEHIRKEMIDNVAIKIMAIVRIMEN